MRKLMVSMSLVLFIYTSASSAGTLRMRIAGPIKDNRYFICVSGVGCVSALNGNKGHTYPMENGEITNITAINATNSLRYLAALPASCHATIGEGQTLTLSGNIVEGTHNRYALTNVRCSIRG
jgi:hypothetical protein